MSTEPAIAKSLARTLPHEEKIYMRSWLLYWWPVWTVGFAMAAWTLVDNRHMALVPAGTVIADNRLVVPGGTEPLLTGVHVSRSRVPGLVFSLTLLAVLAFGNGWLTGWRALTFATTVAALTMLVSWLDWWDELGRSFTYLHVYMNLGAYLILSGGLLLLWLVQFFVVDRRSYVSFTFSQIGIHYTIGQEEKVYDAAGASFEKAPYDWFRWLVGFGAGDLRIRLGGGHVIEIPNVIHVNRRLAAIEKLLRTRDVE